MEALQWQPLSCKWNSCFSDRFNFIFLTIEYCYSFVALSGSLLGGITSFSLRAALSNDQLVAWGWRIPFLCGIFVSYFGFYLRNHGADHDGYHVPSQHEEGDSNLSSIEGDGVNHEIHSIDPKFQNPLRDAFRRKNLRSLFAASLVPMLWSSTFYLTFVWMPIFMAELSDNPVPGAFLINTISLFLSLCLVFPVAGMLSDTYGRVRIMTVGGTMLAILSPLLVIAIGQGKPALALLSQCIMGVSLSLFSAPMCAWLVEAFEPNARLTSVAVGYNIAQALAGGITPFLATLISNDLGQRWPGWIITVVATISLVGLLFIAPKKQLISNDKPHLTSTADSNTIESNDGIL
jgi:MFS transporter, MHS family, proline/betaine transporter